MCDDAGEQWFAADLLAGALDDGDALVRRQRAAFASMAIDEHRRDVVRNCTIIEHTRVAVPVDRAVAVKGQNGRDGHAAEIESGHVRLLKLIWGEDISVSRGP